MKIYRLTQTTNNGYDTYGGAIVAAPSPAAAVLLHPDGESVWSGGHWRSSPGCSYEDSAWVKPTEITVEEVGQGPGPARVLLASFRAG